MAVSQIFSNFGQAEIIQDSVYIESDGFVMHYIPILKAEIKTDK